MNPTSNLNPDQMINTHLDQQKKSISPIVPFVIILIVVGSFIAGGLVFTLINNNSVKDRNVNTQQNTDNFTNEKNEQPNKPQPKNSDTTPIETESEANKDLGLDWIRVAFSNPGISEEIWNLEVPSTHTANTAGLNSGYLGIFQEIEGETYLAELSSPIITDRVGGFPLTLDEYVEYMEKSMPAAADMIKLQIDGADVIIVPSKNGSHSNAYIWRTTINRANTFKVSIVEEGKKESGPTSNKTGDMFLERMVTSLRF